MSASRDRARLLFSCPHGTTYVLEIICRALPSQNLVCLTKEYVTLSQPSTLCVYI